MKDIHLCIITGQPLANLIPLLQERPEHIILVCSKDKLNEAKQFQRTLESTYWKTEKIELHSELPVHEFEKIKEYILNLFSCLLDKDKYPSVRITWNATGGTKQMALAFWSVVHDVAHDEGIRVIYNDTQSGFYEELIPENQPIDLMSVLTPKLYLEAFGKRKLQAKSDDESWKKKVEKRKELTKYFGKNAEIIKSLFKDFNRYYNNDRSGEKPIQLNPCAAKYREAVKRMEKHEIIDKMDGNKYSIKNKEYVSYLAGGWLEEYVWLVAMSEKVDHSDIGLKFDDVRHKKAGERNEVDAFIVHHNRLLLIECKSGRIGREQTKDANMIYKLDSIGAHAGGTQATRLLISAQKLQHTTQEHHKVDTKSRAEANDIVTLEAGELKNFDKVLRHWKEKGEWSAK